MLWVRFLLSAPVIKILIVNTNKDRGRVGLSLAIAYFGSNGYTVSLPLNDTQWYDMIVEKSGIFQTVQCKFSSSENAEISLTSKGGTNGSVYDRITDHPLDILFCSDKDMKDLIEYGNQRSIVLRTTPNSNGQGFNTYKYMVNI